MKRMGMLLIHREPKVFSFLLLIVQHTRRASLAECVPGVARLLVASFQPSLLKLLSPFRSHGSKPRKPHLAPPHSPNGGLETGFSQQQQHSTPVPQHAP